LAANYDNAAWFYDTLSRIVYGQSLVKAQTEFLPLIPTNAKVLIAGGGTGWIIEEVSKQHRSGLEITYVEISAKMIAKARARNYAGNIVNFINLPVEDANLKADYDVVITPFLLDSLSPGVFDTVFNTLSNLLKPDGIWLNTDFQLTGKWWQKLLLKSMYFFFRMIGCVENVDLPLIKQRFLDDGFIAKQEKAFFGEFIGATVYRKV